MGRKRRHGVVIAGQLAFLVVLVHSLATPPTPRAYSPARWCYPCAAHQKPPRRWRRNLTKTSLQMLYGPAIDRLGGSIGSLVAWIRRNGGMVDVSFANDKSLKGWGLIATKEVEAGTCLVSVPRLLCISLTRGMPTTVHPGLSDLFSKVKEGGQREVWAMRLGLALLSERVRAPRASFYEPYIATLPKGHSGVPLFYSNDEMQALQDPVAMSDAKQRSLRLWEFARKELTNAPNDAIASADAFGGQRVDANALGWGLVTAASRALHLQGRDAPPEMVPLVDMANHSEEPNAEVVAVGTEGEVRLVALRPIKAGDFVEVSYGRYTNDELLMDFGILEAKNPRDRVRFDFEVGLLKAARAVAGVMREPFGGSGGSDAIEPFQLRLLRELNLEGPNADRRLSIYRPGHLLTAPLPQKKNADSASLAEKKNSSGISEPERAAETSVTPEGAETRPASEGFSSLSSELLSAESLSSEREENGGSSSFFTSRMYQSDGGNNPKTFAGKTDVSGVDGRLLAALRVLFARTKAELNGLSVTELKRPNGWVSPANERRVLSVVVGLCAVLLRTYGTSLLDDLKTLYGANGNDSLSSSSAEEEQQEGLGVLSAEALAKRAAEADVSRSNGGSDDLTAHNSWLEYLCNPRGFLNPKLGALRARSAAGTGYDKDKRAADGGGSGGGGIAGSGSDGGVTQTVTSVEAAALMAELGPPKWGTGNVELEKLGWEMAQAIGFRAGLKRVLVETVQSVGGRLSEIGVVNGEKDLLERLGDIHLEIERWDATADEDDDEDDSGAGEGEGHAAVAVDAPGSGEASSNQ